MFIEQEAAIEITIKRDSHIRLVRTHCLRRIFPTLRQQRVRDTVGEIAVRLVVNLDKFNRHLKLLETRFDSIDNVTCSAVAGVDDQLQRFEVSRIHIAQQMIHIFFFNRYCFVAAASGRIHRSEVIIFCQTLNIAQTGIAADRFSLATHQLHSVVIHRIMTGRHFYAAIET